MVQRYGREITGGAERLARMFACELARKSQFNVDVYTTTSKNYLKWENSFSPGITKEDGVSVYRFSCKRERSSQFRLFNKIFSKIIRNLSSVAHQNFLQKKILDFLERKWFFLQGPYCPDMIEEIKRKRNTYQGFLFFSYLYYPTILGIKAAGEKAILIPAAHDESPLYFKSVKENFHLARAILANCKEEKDLIVKVYPNLENKIKIAGTGLSSSRIHEPQSRRSTLSIPIPRNPFILFVGRIGKGKGIHTLLSHFNEWVRANPEKKINLVLAGNLDSHFKPPKLDKVFYLGIIDEKTKNKLLDSCLAVVNPSSNESLSLLAVEAISGGKTLIVNAQNPVLKAFEDKIPSVFGFYGENDFLLILDYVTSENWQKRSKHLTKKGELWAKEFYSWNRILQLIKDELVVLKIFIFFCFFKYFFYLKMTVIPNLSNL